MKLFSYALALCILAGGFASAMDKKDERCGCSKPKPGAPAQVSKPTPQGNKPAPQRSACDNKPKA